METTTTKTESARALDLLIRYLTVRDHSRFELKTKLERKFTPEMVEKILAQAEAKGHLAKPEAIANRLVATWHRQLKSQRYIETQLSQRQLPVPPPDAEQELHRARALLEKKFGEATKLSDEERAPAYRFLNYRGFDDHVIRMVLNDQD